MTSTAPSARWRGVENPFDSTAFRASSVFESLDRHAVCGYVAALRGGVPCVISPQFTNGTQHLVIELSFNDGVVWVSRIKLLTQLSPLQKMSMQSEVETMNIVRSQTNIPVPQVYAWDTGTSNVFRAPFIIMQAVNGWDLCNNPEFQNVKYKVLDQMAAIMIELSSVRFDLIGMITTSNKIEPLVIDSEAAGPFACAKNYYNYFINKRQQATGHCIDDKQEPLSETQLCRRIVDDIEFADGPFPLTHVDFGLHNLLIDDDGVVVGVIDWSNARTLPWESFSIFPLPLHVVWPKRNKYPEMKWEQLVNDHEYFVGALKKAERGLNLRGRSLR